MDQSQLLREEDKLLQSARKAEKKSGRRIGYYYIIIKSLKESKKNDVVKCLYIKSLINFGFCVIKEGSLGESKDKDGRDIRDRLIWQKDLHLHLQDKIRVPKYIDSFEENGNYYLVIQLIKGRSLYRFLKKGRMILQNDFQIGGKESLKVIEYLLQITQLLNTLHQNNYVHRDVTPANFIVSSRGDVYIIDLELAYSLDKNLYPPFQIGTFGYMSPQQRAMKEPIPQDDIFAFGAILLQTFTGIHPIKLTDLSIEELEEKIQFLITDQVIGNLILACLNPDPCKRPEFGTIQNILITYKQDLHKKTPRKLSDPMANFSSEQISEIIQDAIYTLSTPLLSDDQNGWFAENQYAEEKENKNQFNKAWYASFNLGVAGVLYFLSQAQKKGFDIERSKLLLNTGLQLIEKKYINRITEISPSLHYGSSGIAVSIASAMTSKLIPIEEKYITWLNKLLSKDNQDINLAYGISGQGIAILESTNFLDEHFFKQKIQQYINGILLLQQRDGSWLRGGKRKNSCDLSLGISGIILFLLKYINVFHNNNNVIESIHLGLLWLMKESKVNDSGVYWTTRSGKLLDYGFLEGNVGIAYTFLKAYDQFKISHYKTFARKYLLSLSPDITHNNLSQGNGLSGLGEVYLTAYQTLNEDEWIKRAGWIAQLLMRIKRSHPQYGTYWLVEHEKNPVPGFTSGNSGIMHFLLRYNNTDLIPFPLLH